MEAVLQGAGEWGSGSFHICWGRGKKEKEVASEMRARDGGLEGENSRQTCLETFR